MSEGIWTVEGPMWTEVGTYGMRWAVIDGDGAEVYWFQTKAQAEEWLELQMAAAEQAARGER